jgi:hypothetical protein
MFGFRNAKVKTQRAGYMVTNSRDSVARIATQFRHEVAGKEWKSLGCSPHGFSPSPLGKNFGSKLVAFRADCAVFADSAGP